MLDINLCPANHHQPSWTRVPIGRDRKLEPHLLHREGLESPICKFVNALRDRNPDITFTPDFLLEGNESQYWYRESIRDCLQTGSPLFAQVFMLKRFGKFSILDLMSLTFTEKAFSKNSLWTINAFIS